MNKELKFSVIIAHLNNSAELYYTLWDLFKELNDFNYEIIVVDNGSKREEYDYIKEYIDKMKEGHNIKLFHYDEYQGTVPPWQYGIKQASGEYLIIIDSHVTVCKDYFKKQYEVLKEDKEIKVLYSSSCFNYYNYEKTSRYYNFKIDNLDLHFVNYDLGERNFNEPLVSQMGCVIVNRKFFTDIGMWGNCFLKYGGYGAEELILAVKTKMFGGKTIFNKDVFFHHSILKKFCGKKLRFQGKAVAAYILDGKDYMLKVIENIPILIKSELDDEEQKSLIEEIPQLADQDRKLLLTAPISYRELLKKYE